MAGVRSRRGRGELLHEMGFSFVGCIRNLTLNVEFENGQGGAGTVISAQRKNTAEYDASAFDDAELPERVEPDGQRSDQAFKLVDEGKGEGKKEEGDFARAIDGNSREDESFRRRTGDSADGMNNTCSNGMYQHLVTRGNTENGSASEFAQETERASIDASHYTAGEQNIKPVSTDRSHSIEIQFDRVPLVKKTYYPNDEKSEHTAYVAKEFPLGSRISNDNQYSWQPDDGNKENDFALRRPNREEKEFRQLPDHGLQGPHFNKYDESVRESMHNKTDFLQKIMGREFGSANQTSGDLKSNGCFKCGNDGHMARECPSKKTGECRIFKQEGHMSRDCTTKNSKQCHNCGQEGHVSRDCTTAKKESRQCHNCGQEGHMIRECTATRVCRKCGQEGHGPRDCPTGKSTVNCYSCGQEGHISRECSTKKSSTECHRCGQKGHIARDCPTSDGARDEKGERPPPYIPPPPPDDDEHIFETLLKGINFNKYDEIPIECTGRNAPANGMNSFFDFGLSEVLQDNILKSKYDKPTPIQKWAIPVILNGRDVMACAVTGSGKTAAFLLPILTKIIRNESVACSEGMAMPEAVILSPTRELAVQIFHETRKFAHNTMVNSAVVYGGVSTMYLFMQLNKGVHIMVATPGRLLDLTRKGKISLSRVKHLVLDEADRMLDLGFLPEIRSIIAEHRMPGRASRQTLMFSATFPDEMQLLASEMLNDYIFITVGSVGGASQDIEQTVHRVRQSEKRQKLFEILQSENARVVVFVELKRNADFLSNQLTQSQFPTASIHGDLSQKDREAGLNDFRTGRATVMVATSVAARGLDIPEVMHVINYDMPSSIEEYVHRIGRTGRCGNLGRATSFFDPDRDSSLTRALVKILVDAKQLIPDWLEEMAVQAVGTGGFAGRSDGRFGARDNRQKFGRGRPRVGEGDASSYDNVSSIKQRQQQPVHHQQQQEEDDTWDD